MEFVKPGKYVELTYDLYEVENGKEELMLSMTSEHPERIVFGVEDNVLPALCDAIEGKQAGDVFDITLTPEEGFGPRRDEHVMELARELFEVDGKFDDKHVYEGASITMMTAEGMPVSGLVEKVTGINVTVDFNHPLAGKTVHFKGRILLVRDATEKELHPSCGGGCCGCGDEHCGHDHGCSDHDGCGGCCH